MLVKKNELIDDLKRVMPGIATGNVTLECADSFVFTEDNCVYSYNSAVSVMIPLSQELKLSGTVQAVDFFNCIQKMPDDFELESKDGVWVLKCGKIKAKVNCLASVKDIIERFEQIKPVESNWVDIPDNEFNNALAQCNMPKNTTTYAGVFVGKNEMISSDGLQINKCDLKGNYPLFWISNKAVAEILKWNDFTKLQLNKTWLQFSNGSVVFSVKTLYAEVDKIIEKISGGLDKVKTHEVVLEGSFNDEVYKAIDRATTFSENIMNRDSVVITFEGKNLTVSAKRKSGEFSESVDIGTEVDEKLSFALALNMMGNVSKFYKDFVLLDDKPNPPRLLFKNDNSVHLVATLKM